MNKSQEMDMKWDIAYAKWMIAYGNWSILRYANKYHGVPESKVDKAFEKMKLADEELEKANELLQEYYKKMRE
jgi:hypothetical protein